MKNNVFLPWGMPTAMMGRKEDLRLVSSMLERLSSGQSFAVAIVGGPGTGKTTVLKTAEKEAKEHGFVVIFIKAPYNGNEKQLIREIAANYGSADIKAPYKGENLTGVLNMIKKTAARGPLVLIIDDIDEMQATRKIVLDLINAIKTEDSGLILGSNESFPAADANDTLAPVGEHEFREYLEKMTKGKTKFGDECIKAMYNDCGGNPKLLQLCCYYLYDNAKETEKIITQAHYNAARRGLLSFLSHEWFAKLYNEAPEGEAVVRAKVAKKDETTANEIAKILQKKQGGIATLLMRLEQRGEIIKKSRGHYQIFCPLYRQYVIERN